MAAEDLVSAVATKDSVIILAAVEEIIAAGAIDEIPALAAEDAIIADVETLLAGCIAIEKIIEFCADDLISS